MTLAEIQTLLVGADPDIKHYFSMKRGKAYSYWEETQRLATMADDHHADDAWRFYVHRYTKEEYDEIASHLFRVLDDHPGISVIHTVDYDPDSGYIHHIYECEGY